ncbi:MAG: enoyl-CoA hydratase/isomerase family protein, partial [Acidimicrobiales bacterium]|nr:enoyl-CoA hydratase/isomerase family protein [Acidimicrobiales bacterium]
MSTHSDVVIYEISSGIATIILNRPENKNALSVEMVNAIGDCFDRAQNDPNARVILFTNSGNTFCA